MDIDTSDGTLTVTHEPQRGRFTLALNGTHIGQLAYRDTRTKEGATMRVFTHTEVSPAYGNRGYAAHLVRFALESAAEAGLNYRTTCSYVMHFLDRNPEFRESQL